MTTIEPANWRPTTYAQAVADIGNQDIRETHFLELKRCFDRGQSGIAHLYKALASLANHGGTLVIGVEEDKPQGRAMSPHPVKLAGEVERVMQVAASLDPPLALPTPFELADPYDPTQGIIVVVVPASPMAPHRTPRNGYFARDAKRAFPMPDTQLEQLIRLRGDRTIQVEAALDTFLSSIGQMIAPSAAYPTAWFAFAIDPAPSHQPFLLRSRLNDNARSWLDGHIAAAGNRVQDLIVGDPAMGQVGIRWAPFYRQPGPERVDGGARFASTYSPPGNPPKVGVIEVMETGAIRVAENHLNDEGTTVVRWQELLGAAAWTVSLFHSVQQEAGAAVGANVAFQFNGIKRMTPDTNFGDLEQRRQRQRDGWTPNQHPGKRYRATCSLSGVEVGGELHDALDWLFGPMLRNFGLPDLLYRAEP